MKENKILSELNVTWGGNMPALAFSVLLCHGDIMQVEHYYTIMWTKKLTMEKFHGILNIRKYRSAFGFPHKKF